MADAQTAKATSATRSLSRRKEPDDSRPSSRRSGEIGSPLMSFSRLTLYLGFTLLLLPVQIVAVALKLPLAKRLPYWYHRRCRRLLGLRVVRRGRQSREHPTLYVSNHVSYLDVAVLGSLIQGSFVAKAEVATWPLFGTLAKLQRSIFVERRPQRAAAGRDEMTKRLEAGDDLILFPEGTSGDGNRALPFRSALFSVAEQRPHGAPLTVQPVSVAYTLLDGFPMGRYLRPFFAWYGDMELVGHMWQGMGLGRLTVVVEFHPTVTIDQFGSRKALAEHCHREVSQGISAALVGRSRRQIAARAENKPPALPESEAAESAGG
ncbi:MAG: lysophospholipid acyltransferase family protein [Rhodovibrionaceae bacterium]